MSELQEDETPNLIAADKVQGTTVYNDAGEKLGTVEKVMIDKRTGRVAYAIMSFGGFLGIGEKYHPLPWQLLSYDTEQDGYQVALSKDVLENAPSYDVEEPVDYNDVGWRNRIDSYYRTDPLMAVQPGV